MSRRVVITGLGMVSPLGNDVESSWSRLLAGESGAAEITAFDHTDYNVHFACELKDFDPTVWVDRKASRRMDRFAQMILASARQAEAGLRRRRLDRPRPVRRLDRDRASAACRATRSATTCS